MIKEENNQLREEIFKELVKKKEEIDKTIFDCISDLKRLIAIEKETGRIIILYPTRLKNMAKIKLVAIGKFFALKAGILESPEINIQIIADETGILKTTLSAPLGELVKRKILLKPKENNYAFNEFILKEEISKILNEVGEDAN